jgi:hypothetical protein
VRRLAQAAGSSPGAARIRRSLRISRLRRSGLSSSSILAAERLGRGDRDFAHVLRGYVNAAAPDREIVRRLAGYRCVARPGSTS